MIDNEINEITHHAMLVTWGEFAQSVGLIQAVEGVPLHQKKVTHEPQTKILEFFVAILTGLEYLKDLSRSARPIDQDQAVAKAWLQRGWADYSGVSRTLTSLSQEEAEQVAAVLHKITKLILDTEIMKALQVSGRLTYDGDLTGRPVSNRRGAPAQRSCLLSAGTARHGTRLRSVPAPPLVLFDSVGNCRAPTPGPLHSDNLLDSLLSCVGTPLRKLDRAWQRWYASYVGLGKNLVSSKKMSTQAITSLGAFSLPGPAAPSS